MEAELLALSGVIPQKSSDIPWEDKWKAARSIVDMLGPFPVMFTTPIRALISDHRQNQPISPASHFLTTRLLRSPSLKAMFYYISLTLWHDKITNSAYLSSSDLIRLFRPKDCAALIGVMYLTKRLRSFAAQKLDNCEPIFQRITIRSEMGAHLGIAIPKLGCLKGIFTGAFRDISLLLLALHSQSSYEEYQAHLLDIGSHFDLEKEEDLWGCNHLDVAANCIQLLGFGTNEAHAIVLGMGNSKEQFPELNLEAFEYQLTENWIKNLLRNRSEPQQTHLGEYYPREKEMHRLLYEAGAIHENGSKHSWLLKTKDDINPQETPQLFQEFLMELESTDSIKQFYEENLPDDVLEGLSDTQLQELSSKINDSALD